jgi:dolichyl-phosphate-mannose--protein O-mannosyl transferase
VRTGRNLHSHGVQSWLAKGNHEEVSGFGEQGRGDQLDDWVLECKDKYKGTVLMA